MQHQSFGKQGRIEGGRVLVTGTHVTDRPSHFPEVTSGKLGLNLKPV